MSRTDSELPLTPLPDVVAARARRISREPSDGRVHRKDIDGLRAIAVLAVILSHAGFEAFSGGFIGVDVFFVISGFLITGILIREHEERRFTFRDFYMRRVRRILPALIVVVAACFPFAWWLMFPDFIQNFGQSAVATLLFSNNLLLAVTSGYWELESDFKPLLHTWSLGVEEQFYIVFPLFFLLITLRWGKRRQVGAISLVAAISLLLAEVGWRVAPDASFYLPVTRAWELMVGSVAAYMRPTGHPGERVLPGLGLVAILAPVFLYSSATPSPSLLTFIPVAGTALVLVYGQGDPLAQRALSVKPLVFIGLVSYSAYLWHQPVFAFTRVASLSEPDPVLMGGLAGLTFLLAWLSWRFVEEPFRNRKRIGNGRTLAFVLPSTAVLAVLGLVLHFNQGFPSRTFPNLAAAGDVYISYNERVRQYQIDPATATEPAEILVVGDSFGRDVANVLLESAPEIASHLAYYPDYPQSRADLEQLAPVVDTDTRIVLAVHAGSPADVLETVRGLHILSPNVTVFGPKDWGWNLNPFARVPPAQRDAARAQVAPEVVALNDTLADQVVGYVDVIRLLGDEEGRRVRVFDPAGNPLSPDRIHLTRYGAIVLAQVLQEREPEVLASIVDEP